MGVNLAQFHEGFFDESFEALGTMESAFLKLDLGAPDPEVINTVFRVAHSIKGGAGMFGFAEIASFTHTLETLLHELRTGRRQVTRKICDLLLRSVDVLREMLQASRRRESPDAQRVADLQFELEVAVAAEEHAAASAVPGAAPSSAAAPVVASEASAPAPAAPGTTAPTAAAGVAARRRIRLRPLEQMLKHGNEPLTIVANLAKQGELSVVVSLDALPRLADLDPERCYLHWELHLSTGASRAQLAEDLQWLDGDCELSIEEEVMVSEGPPPAVAVSPTGAAPERARGAELEAEAQSQPAGAGGERAKSEPPTPRPGADSNSIRVSVEKIDELINTVGEIVITQSMLAQLGVQVEGPGVERLRVGLAQLERNVRELHENVMRVRMLPIGVAFSRFPRLVRDLSQRLGKQIELKMTGEQTELDKTVLERIGDPLVHLVRNCIDHGIEMPERRTAAGKPTAGTVHLEAFHRGSAIIIEVGDDGQGLDTERILAKARSRGLLAISETPSNDAVHDLIFLPGFSTAEQTTDLSGRGVGMDVVRRNVKALGGKIEIRSERGRGSRFIISLPLTLAIVDGQSVRVGPETYIVPLVSIVESLQVKAGNVNRLSGVGEVFTFRGAYLPIVRLHELFGVAPRARELHQGLVVVAEGDGQRIGLFVDDLRGQQQVVIKSLEANYGQVPGVSGATILGDGSVALILDLPGLIRYTSRRQAA